MGRPVRRRAVSFALALAAGVALLAPAPAAAEPFALPDPVRSALDGNPATTERLDAADPVSAAVAVSQQRFDGAAGGRAATHVVLARDDDFADSLAGAALTGTGPLLLTASDQLTAATQQEIQRVLAPGGRVLVLGGDDAIAPAVTAGLAGYAVERLAGTTRVETAIAVADAVRAGTAGDRVLLARSDAPAANPTAAWADSVTAGALAAATRTPILVTPTAALHDAVAAWLAADAPASVVLLGGEAALSPAVANAVPGAQRVFGADRTGTAGAVAEDLWDADGQGARRYVILDGGRADGWAYGLSAAGLAADAVAPPLLVVGAVAAATRRLVSACGAPAVDLLLVGSSDVITADVAGTLDGYDGSSCGGAAALRRLASCEETLAYFREQALQQVGPYGLDGFYWGGQEPVPVDGPVVAGPEPAPEPGAPPGEGSEDGGGLGGDDDVSGTNVQEAGVDEPDLLKVRPDGSAAYVVAGGGLQVVDLTGPSPVLAGTLELPLGYGQELLLAGNTLVVLANDNGYVYPPGVAEDGTYFAPPHYFPEPQVTLTRYDVSNPLSPQKLDELTVDGAYRTARLIGSTARVVVSANPQGFDFVFPEDESQEAHDRALAHNREVVANAPVTAWLPNMSLNGGAEQPAVPCDQVDVPPDFSGLSTVTVLGIDVASGLTPTSSAAVVAMGEIVYASAERLVVTTSQWGVWTDVPPSEGVHTELHSFAIDDPATTTYVASGKVDGYVLNQFALSERDGYLRVATTTEAPWTDDGPGQTDNGLTVLAEGGGQLFEVGRLFGLGAGERIYAVRFLGSDLAAIVTFRQVDPLFLVDLGNPAAPTLIGELHVPGFSSYLHPVDEDHLLGLGQDATDEGQVTGLQVSLFDISDRANPVRTDQLLLGSGYSEAEYDHRAFLYWAPEGLAVIPAQVYDPSTGSNGFNGAIGIDVDAAAGSLDERGRVGHAQQDVYYRTVRRSFVAGPRLFTVSDVGIGVADLTTLVPGGFAEFPQSNAPPPCCVIDDPDPGQPPPDPGQPVADGSGASSSEQEFMQ